MKFVGDVRSAASADLSSETSNRRIERRLEIGPTTPLDSGGYATDLRDPPACHA
jgi:hypothetical protein